MHWIFPNECFLNHIFGKILITTTSCFVVEELIRYSRTRTQHFKDGLNTNLKTKNDTYMTFIMNLNLLLRKSIFKYNIRSIRNFREKKE